MHYEIEKQDTHISFSPFALTICVNFLIKFFSALSGVVKASLARSIESVGKASKSQRNDSMRY